MSDRATGPTEGDLIEISATPVNMSRLVTELEALAIPGVRTYSLVGTEEACIGVYPWDASAPAGEFWHVGASLSEADKQRIRDAIAVHDPAPTPVVTTEDRLTALESGLDTAFGAIYGV